jgi:hypothetical protein
MEQYRLNNEEGTTGNGRYNFLSTFSSLSSLFTNCSDSSVNPQLQTQQTFLVRSLTQNGALTLKRLEETGDIECLSFERSVRQELRFGRLPNQEADTVQEQDDHLRLDQQMSENFNNDEAEEDKAECEEEPKKTTDKRMLPRNYMQVNKQNLSNFAGEDDTDHVAISHLRTRNLDLSMYAPKLIKPNAASSNLRLPGVNKKKLSPYLTQKTLARSSSMYLRGDNQKRHLEISGKRITFASPERCTSRNRFACDQDQVNLDNPRTQQRMAISLN